VLGRSRRVWAVRLLIALVPVLTGVALATPVPVLAISSDRDEVLGHLPDGTRLTYAYRQSIYDVPVFEEFVRAGDSLDLLRVRSPDIRSIEYFRWEGQITREGDYWVEDAPASEQSALVIRITTLGEQRIYTRDWSVDLRGSFGESVVTVRAGHRPAALFLVRGRW